MVKLIRSLRVRNEVLYSHLPEHVLCDGKKLGLNKDVKPKQILSAFLQRHANRKKIEEGVEVLVKRSTFSLDNTIVRHRKIKTSRRKGLPRKEIKKLTKLRPEDAVYDLYLPMHNLWKEYINDLIKFDSLSRSGLTEAARRLMNADLHGALMYVTRSKCPSLIGASGILLQEKKNVFILVTAENKLKTVPKAHSVFTLEINGHVFTIYGNNFRQRASERCIGSFKGQKSIDL